MPTVTQLYLRPMGLLWGEDAEAAAALGEIGRVAGGRTGFALVEIINRDGRHVQRERRGYRDIAGSKDPKLKERLALIEAPRGLTDWLGPTSPAIMGIVNVTPDSFSDGGDVAGTREAVARGRALAEEGASIVDVGGESTRPGSEGVSIEEEQGRVLAVVRELSARGICVSIDTRKSEIMRAAVEAGAAMINDVSALRFDSASLATAAELGRPVCLMHAQGDPNTMQIDPVYDDVVLDVFDELQDRIDAAERAGLPRTLIAADPGIGFGKTYRHNLEILRALSIYHGLGVPLVVGASRKAFIGALTGEKAAKERVFGSVAVAVAAAAQGAQILRVHDVKATAQALTLWNACIEPGPTGL